MGFRSFTDFCSDIHHRFKKYQKHPVSLSSRKPKAMKNTFLLLLTALFLFSACTKEDMPAPAGGGNTPTSPAPAPASNYISFRIKAGQNYCEGNNYPSINLQQLSFQVIFDSSAIYTTADAANQRDINKLYGFSDSMTHHHTNSARFGWNWYNNELHLHAYTYIHGTRKYKELTTIPLNTPITCSISVLPGQYIFTVNGSSTTLERGCEWEKAAGYKLYPYFGGDEPAPHDVVIKIREL